MGQCVCDQTNNWTGLDCSQQTQAKECPSNDKDTVCSTSGTCNNGTCVCNMASSGVDCSRGMPNSLFLSIKKHSPVNLFLLFILVAVLIYFIYIFATHWHRTKEVKDLHKHINRELRKMGVIGAQR
jgi:hypothetical protein